MSEVPAKTTEQGYIDQQKDTNRFLELHKRAILAHNNAYNLILRNDYENDLGECMVRESLAKREKIVHQMCRNLQDEIDNIDRQYREIADNIEDLDRAINYFKNVLETTEMCKKYRQGIKNLNKGTDDALEQETAAIKTAIATMENLKAKILECLKDHKNMKKALVTELNLKVENFLGIKGCRHAKPLFSDKFDYMNEMKSYIPGTEDEWEKNIRQMICHSQNLRQLARDLCAYAEDAIRDHKANVAKARMKTDRALADEIMKDKYMLDCNQTQKEINYGHLHIDSMHDKYELDERYRLLNLWRLYRLNNRPVPENIRDEPVKRIEDELQELDKRLLATVEQTDVDKKLLLDLCKLKEDIINSMNDAAIRIHANRENCQGVRRHAVIEGISHD